MKRYSIMVRFSGAQSESELCQCDNNAEAIAEAALKKKLGRQRINKYDHVYVRENEQAVA